MTNPALKKVYADLASRTFAPQVEVQAFLPLGAQAFKVVASTHGVANETDFSEAIATMTDGKGRLVPDSYKSRGNLAVGIVVANAQSRPLDASFTMVTAATAADASGTIWRVESDNGGKRVVLESSDDLNGIFNDRMARRTHHSNPVEGRGLATASFSNGDLVRYVDVDSATASWGVALRDEAGVKVYGPELSLRSLNPDAVVASVPRARLPRELASAVQPFEANAKLSSEKMSKILEYLGKAYGPASGELISKFRKIAGEA